LTNIFRLIPKLSFDQTSNRESNIKTIFIPKDKQLTIIFWSLSIYMTLSLICSSIFKGYLIIGTNINKRKLFFILIMLLNSITILIRVFIGICFIYYGRISVNLTNQSMILAGIDDIKDINDNRSNILNKLHVHKVLFKNAYIVYI
jgi:hypothetical protein